MKKAGNVFGIITGIGMISMWGVLFVTGQIQELNTEPLRISAHILSEGLTAIALLAGGILSLKGHDLGKRMHLISLGMLMYSVLTAGGYYLQLNDLAMTGMFGVLFVATVVFACANLS
ncbi:hypothetical protein [Acidaminobacter hydrogenoformans]|uniref:DUF8058 domain-containing protein n=1 Tax=Acidaminobacter hydrogenoformans DSM 2784 TaxID=1120920 RepID=A0A1G5S464_9FIRM|nr:hypothetical protein [Acidaminobacter hydrogenoformans]SCZ81113.1 hypothetical protein SAMN03080599_02614 [Acidaminobacter hydrogenoformans DSM 2784]